MPKLVFLVKTLLIRVKEIWVTPLFEASLNYQDALNIMHYLLKCRKTGNNHTT